MMNKTDEIATVPDPQWSHYCSFCMDDTPGIVALDTGIVSVEEGVFACRQHATRLFKELDRLLVAGGKDT